jgi:hypothetical protein
MKVDQPELDSLEFGLGDNGFRPPLKLKLRGLSPRTNYTDRAPAVRPLLSTSSSLPCQIRHFSRCPFRINSGIRILQTDSTSPWTGDQPVAYTGQHKHGVSADVPDSTGIRIHGSIYVVL